MSEIADIKLYLRNETSVSNLKKIVYQEELNDINDKYPLQEGKIDFRATYFLKNKNQLEVGFFIRSGLKNELSMEKVPLTIEDMDGKKLVTQIFNLKRFGKIPPMSGRPAELKFNLPKDVVYYKEKEYVIKMDSEFKMKAFSSVETSIENIPVKMPYEQEKALKEFENSLPTLKENGFDITLYKLFYNTNRALNCTVLIRNGKDVEAKLQKLPVTVINKKGKSIARAVFENKEGIIKVSPKKSSILTLEFPPEAVAPGIHKLEGCIVEYK